ncbi:MAG: hypothetical protein HKO96_10930 [Flavobacteriaceae bacterium]|nr:hypothetical protein [Bacteroidia bacterium]NNK70980.1 hypothetical protein [Flavobacteriaceae bacterium]NNL80467.1 hypothetical protein [Flavobacteriaceae bacterium]
MSKQQQTSTSLKLSQDPTDKKGLIVGSIVATLIAASPYLFYIYRSVPEVQVWDTSFFTIESTYYADVNTLVWAFMVKLVPLILLLLWFFTCRHWWYHALLVPIAMYCWQIFGVINDESQFLDELGLIYLLPVMAVIIPSIYLIRAQMFNKINIADKSMEELEEEFKIKPKSFLEKISDYF